MRIRGWYIRGMHAHYVVDGYVACAAWLLDASPRARRWRVTDAGTVPLCEVCRARIVAERDAPKIAQAAE